VLRLNSLACRASSVLSFDNPEFKALEYFFLS
jgi:hypothetical protein